MGFDHWRGRSLLPILYLYYLYLFCIYICMCVCILAKTEKQILVPMGFDRWKKPIAYSLSRVGEGLAPK